MGLGSLHLHAAALHIASLDMSAAAFCPRRSRGAPTRRLRPSPRRRAVVFVARRDLPGFRVCVYEQLFAVDFCFRNSNWTKRMLGASNLKSQS